ncbi:MAG: GDP-mannose 4,6-dehydratase [Dehalococcoidia bacterium]|nr:GDP-mannose 4,6-dehydratase [Chloroflexota bacterium]MCK4242747.1 GDP-mannose 4,6-dehydratase [Dehalococcoidia bacterium]
MRVLITGVTGMAGSHLAEYLLAMEGVEVFGTYRWRSRMDNLEELRSAGKVKILGDSTTASAKNLDSILSDRTRAASLSLIEGDITDPFSMKHIIAAVKPDRIFHLAAQSYVPGSWDAPAETLHRNILGQVNLLEAVREAKVDPVIHIAGSSEEYGHVLPEELPVKETNPLRPLSPYGVSKVAQEMLGYQYFMSYGLKTIVTRGFNHEGPRRGEVFVTSSVAKQVAEIEKGLKPPTLYVGNLSSKRDWSDVRDFVRAYWLATEKCVPGEIYNIGSEVAREVGEMVDMLLSMTDANIEVRVDASRFRPSDVKVLVADATKFKKATGWEPQIPFEKTLRDLLDYWRARV